MTDPQEVLTELGLRLPEPWKPGARLRMARRAGGVLHLATHLGIDLERRVVFNGRERHPIVTGVAGRDVDARGAALAARGAVLNMLATVRAELGTLNAVAEILEVRYAVCCEPGFTALHQAADHGSDLLVKLFGEAGEHARTTNGVTALPGGAVAGVAATIMLR